LTGLDEMIQQKFVAQIMKSKTLNLGILL